MNQKRINKYFRMLVIVSMMILYVGCSSSTNDDLERYGDVSALSSDDHRVLLSGLADKRMNSSAPVKTEDTEFSTLPSALMANISASTSEADNHSNGKCSNGNTKILFSTDSFNVEDIWYVQDSFWYDTSDKKYDTCHYTSYSGDFLLNKTYYYTQDTLPETTSLVYTRDAKWGDNSRESIYDSSGTVESYFIEEVISSSDVEIVRKTVDKNTIYEQHFKTTEIISDPITMFHEADIYYPTQADWAQRFVMLMNDVKFVYIDKNTGQFDPTKSVFKFQADIKQDSFIYRYYSQFDLRSGLNNYTTYLYKTESDRDNDRETYADQDNLAVGKIVFSETMDITVYYKDGENYKKATKEATNN